MMHCSSGEAHNKSVEKRKKVSFPRYNRGSWNTNFHSYTVNGNISCPSTFRLQQWRNIQTAMGDLEGQLDVPPGITGQTLPQVNQGRVYGLDQSHDGHPAAPALAEILHLHPKPIWTKLVAVCLSSLIRF